jgi:Protein of unknown function (DUF1236)
MKRKLIAGAAVSLLLSATATAAVAQVPDRARRGGDGAREMQHGGGNVRQQQGVERSQRQIGERRVEPRVERQRTVEPRRLERQTPRRVEREPQERQTPRRAQRQDDHRDAQKTQRDRADREKSANSKAQQEQRERNEARNRQGNSQQVRHLEASNQQRTQFREHLFRERGLHRISRREFGGSIHIGGHVNRRHHLYPITSAILVFAPIYRGYDYIVVEDTICIVDPATYVIVDVIPASLQYADGQRRRPLPQLTLSASDMHLIYASVPKDVTADVRVRLALGATVPERVELLPFPDSVVERVGELEGYRYVVVESDVVVVDPADRSVALVITE